MTGSLFDLKNNRVSFSKSVIEGLVSPLDTTCGGGAGGGRSSGRSPALSSPVGCRRCTRRSISRPPPHIRARWGIRWAAAPLGYYWAELLLIVKIRRRAAFLALLAVRALPCPTLADTRGAPQRTIHHTHCNGPPHTPSERRASRGSARGGAKGSPKATHSRPCLATPAYSCSARGQTRG